jgi:hypothetical protein
MNEDRCHVRAGAHALAALRNLVLWTIRSRGLLVPEARKEFREDRTEALAPPARIFEWPADGLSGLSSVRPLAGVARSTLLTGAITFPGSVRPLAGVAGSTLLTGAITCPVSAITRPVSAVTGSISAITRPVSAVTGSISAITGSVPVAIPPIPVAIPPIPVAIPPIPVAIPPIPVAPISLSGEHRSAPPFRERS